jgi:hypothetical protein
MRQRALRSADGRISFLSLGQTPFGRGFSPLGVAWLQEPLRVGKGFGFSFFGFLTSFL